MCCVSAPLVGQQGRIEANAWLSQGSCASLVLVVVVMVVVVQTFHACEGLMSN